MSSLKLRWTTKKHFEITEIVEWLATTNWYSCRMSSAIWFSTRHDHIEIIGVFEYSDDEYFSLLMWFSMLLHARHIHFALNAVTEWIPGHTYLFVIKYSMLSQDVYIRFAVRSIAECSVYKNYSFAIESMMLLHAKSIHSDGQSFNEETSFWS
jgi:hypothetical protein